jgi:predicted dehydrogenase
VTQTVKIGILGCINLHTQRYVESILKSPRAELAGISEEGDAAAIGERTASELGVPFFRSHDELLDLQDIDGVYLGTLPVDHLDAIERAAQRDVHVLCDKPLATTLADAKAADRVANQAGIKLMVSFFPRFQLPLIKAKETLDGGEYGEVVAIYAVKHGRVPTKAATDLPTGWYLDPESTGGGGFLDIGIHAMDALRWLSGSEPVTVKAHVGNMVNAGLGNEDFGVATYEFENGVVATLSAGWANPDHSPTWLDVKFEILTTKGVFIINKPHHDLALYTNESAMRLAWLRPDTDLQIDAFTRMVTEDLEPPIRARDGVAALAMGLGAYESSKRGSKVEIAPLIAEA